MHTRNPRRAPRSGREVLRDALFVAPGLVILVVGFALFAILYPPGSAPLVAAPRAEPAPTNAPPTPAAITLPSATAVNPSPWPAQADPLGFAREGSKDAAAVPQPVNSQESREISCPVCGGKGTYVVQGKDGTCPRCGGTGRCQAPVAGRN